MKTREETVTKAIMCWLEDCGWKIICFDFPQSGTGFMLHSNEASENSKNKGSIIPDIIAIKDGVVAFFENKDRFVLSDFEKVRQLRENNQFSMAIKRLLINHSHHKIVYGVGLPYSINAEKKVSEFRNMVDFVIFYSNTNIEIFFDGKSAF